MSFFARFFCEKKRMAALHLLAVVPVCFASSYFWSSAAPMLVLERMFKTPPSTSWRKTAKHVARYMMIVCYARPLAWLWVAEVFSVVVGGGLPKLLQLVNFKDHFMHVPCRMARIRPNYFRALSRHKDPVRRAVSGAVASVAMVLMARTAAGSVFSLFWMLAWCVTA